MSLELEVKSALGQPSAPDVAKPLGVAFRAMRVIDVRNAEGAAAIDSGRALLSQFSHGGDPA